MCVCVCVCVFSGGQVLSMVTVGGLTSQSEYGCTHTSVPVCSVVVYTHCQKCYIGNCQNSHEI